jgi:hypothetical protein
MAGNTGKMTAAAIAARGPRFRLISAHKNATFADAAERVGFVIDQEGRTAVNGAFAYSHDLHTRVYARSYSLSYLLRLIRVVKP